MTQPFSTQQVPKIVRNFCEPARKRHLPAPESRENTWPSRGTGHALLGDIMTNNTTNREMAAITSLDDEWTERTVVTPDRRRVLRALRAREAAYSVAARIHSVIDDMLACDLYGELSQAAGFGAEVRS